MCYQAGRFQISRSAHKLSVWLGLRDAISLVICIDPKVVFFSVEITLGTVKEVC